MARIQFHPGLRIYQSFPSGEEELQPPDPLPRKIFADPVQIVVASLLGGGAGFFIYPTLAKYTSPQIAMVGVGVAMLGGGYGRIWLQQREQSNQKKHRKAEYVDYLNSLEPQLREAAGRGQTSLNFTYPSLADCCEWARQRHPRLFERRSEDQDFLHVRIGRGRVPFPIALKGPNSQKVGQQDDPLTPIIEEFKEKYRFLPDVPIPVDLRALGTLGLTGLPNERLASLSAFLVHLCSLHNPTQVKIVACLQEGSALDWIRWLPHCWADDRRSRFVCSRSQDAKAVLGELTTLLKRRKAESQEKKKEFSPVLVFVLEDESVLDEAPDLRKLIFSEAAGLGCLVVVGRDGVSTLPAACKTVLEVSRGKGSLVIDGNKDQSDIELDSIEPALVERWARNLAPLEVASTNQAAGLPDSLTLLQLLNSQTVEDLEIDRRWHQSKPYESLAVPLGLREGGKLAYLNLTMEDQGSTKGHGPHGLVAGTTGSGKTAFLTTYLASLVAHFHPHEMSILAIDFKGGDLFKGLEDIPHLVGTITNLDGATVARCVKALKAENARRQRIFAAVGRREGIVINKLEEYQLLRRQKPSLEPVAKLLIICDEFAEMAAENYELLEELVRVARVGRAQGIHLLLATQQPGIVKNFDKIEPNLRFRIALKFNSVADSKLVIKTPDAASIRVPGRGYLKVGENEIYELFQGAWGGAAYKTELASGPTVSRVGLGGGRRPLAESTVSLSSQKGLTEIQAIAQKIIQISQSKNIVRLDGPWLAPLSPSIPLARLEQPYWDGAGWLPLGPRERLTCVLGSVDDVPQREQPDLVHDFLTHGNLAIYGKPMAGATTLAQTLLTSVVAKNSPRHAGFYIVDFGQSFTRFKNLPHTGELLSGEERIPVLRLLRFLQRQVYVRRQLLSSRLEQSFATHLSSPDPSLPAIIFILDGYSKFLAGFADEHAILETIAQEGPGVGIFTIISATSPSRVKTNLATCFGRSLCLRLADSDRTEYSLAIPRPAEIEAGTRVEPENRAGRGLCEGWLEFQAALPAESNTALDSFFAGICSGWKGESTRRVPVAPVALTLHSLLQSVEAPETLALVGFDLDDVAPLWLTLESGQHWLVTGSKKSGKTTLLMSLALSMSYFWSPEQLNLQVVDWEGRLKLLSHLPHVESLISEQRSLRQLNQMLRKEAESRKERLRQARLEAEGMLDENEFLGQLPQVVVIADDYAILSREAGPAFQELLDILADAASFKISLLISAGITDFRGYSDPLGSLLATSQCGLNLNSREAPEALGGGKQAVADFVGEPGVGVLVRAGHIGARFRAPRILAEDVKAILPEAKSRWSKSMPYRLVHSDALPESAPEGSCESPEPTPEAKEAEEEFVLDWDTFEDADEIMVTMD
ncbi:type VII secretion protein EssC [bacterium]|nr:type VII secretion protein EssC [bacterium]